jgi:hypothetical protein
MKKNHLSFILIFLISIAHIARGQRFGFEYVAGPSIASLYGNTYIDRYHHPKLSVFAGIGCGYKITSRSSLHVNVLFDRKGSSGKSANTEWRDENGNVLGTGRMSFSTNYDYITIPLTYGFSFGRTLNFRIDAGGYLAYLVDQKEHYNRFFSQPPTTIREKGQFKKTDFGISAGLFLYVPLTEKWNIKTGILNNLGLTNISKIPTVGSGSIKTFSCNLMIGVSRKLT